MTSTQEKLNFPKNASVLGETEAKMTRRYPGSIALRKTVLRLVFLIALTTSCRPWALFLDDGIPAWVTARQSAEANGLAKGLRSNDSVVISQQSVLTLESLKGIKIDEAGSLMDKSSTEEVEGARKPLLDILTHAGLKVDENVTRMLPKWSQVKELYGSKPVIFGKQYCKPFRDAVPKETRFVAVAGQMNTGTNALYKYLYQNMYIPENKQYNGVLWTIPWYKHVSGNNSIRPQLLAIQAHTAHSRHGLPCDISICTGHQTSIQMYSLS